MSCSSNCEDVVRGCFGEICEALAVLPTALEQCAIHLFAKGVIDQSMKQYVTRQSDLLAGANALLDCLLLKIRYIPEEFDIIIDIFSQIEVLKVIAQKMKDRQATDHTELGLAFE